MNRTLLLLLLLLGGGFTLLLLFATEKPEPLPQRGGFPLPKGVDISRFPPGTYGGRLIDVSPGEPTTFNPLVTEDATSSGMIALMSSGLTEYDPVSTKVIPGLAESWEIGEDKKTFTFRLREGLKWSDGHPLTVDDIIFTFDCVYDERFPNRLAHEYSVDGKPFEYEKVDDLTLRIRTPDIYAPFLKVIGWARILPKHELEPFAKDGSLQKQLNISVAQKTPEKILSSGIFRIRSYRSGERIVFEPNPHYYRADSKGQRLPYVDFYVIKFVKDFNASAIAFASGLTDSEGIRPDDVPWMRKAAKVHDFTIHERGPATSSNFIWFNQNPGQNKEGKPFVEPYKLKWFRDQRFRQAVSYGIDRQGIIDGVLFGSGAPLWGPESPSNKEWYSADLMQYPYDVEKALSLLREAGFHQNKEGELLDAEDHRVSFSLITNQENQIRQNIATIFMENMKALGIEVNLQFIDFGTFVGKIQDSYDYEAGLLGFTGGGDPVGGMSIYHSKGRLHQWHPNQESPATDWEARIDELMVKQIKTLDPAERYQSYAEVQRIMSEQLPFIYLITPNAYAGLKNRIQNVDIPPLGSVLWNIDSVWTLEP